MYQWKLQNGFLWTTTTSAASNNDATNIIPPIATVTTTNTAATNGTKSTLNTCSNSNDSLCNNNDDDDNELIWYVTFLNSTINVLKMIGHNEIPYQTEERQQQESSSSVTVNHDITIMKEMTNNATTEIEKITTTTTTTTTATMINNNIDVSHIDNDTNNIMNDRTLTATIISYNDDNNDKNQNESSNNNSIKESLSVENNNVENLIMISTISSTNDNEIMNVGEKNCNNNSSKESLSVENNNDENSIMISTNSTNDTDNEKMNVDEKNLAFVKNKRIKKRKNNKKKNNNNNNNNSSNNNNEEDENNNNIVDVDDENDDCSENDNDDNDAETKHKTITVSTTTTTTKNDEKMSSSNTTTDDNDDELKVILNQLNRKQRRQFVRSIEHFGETYESVLQQVKETLLASNIIIKQQKQQKTILQQNNTNDLITPSTITIQVQQPQNTIQQQLDDNNNNSQQSNQPSNNKCNNQQFKSYQRVNELSTLLHNAFSDIYRLKNNNNRLIIQKKQLSNDVDKNDNGENDDDRDAKTKQKTTITVSTTTKIEKNESIVDKGKSDSVDTTHNDDVQVSMTTMKNSDNSISRQQRRANKKKQYFNNNNNNNNNNNDSTERNHHRDNIKKIALEHQRNRFQQHLVVQKNQQNQPQQEKSSNTTLNDTEANNVIQGRGIQTDMNQDKVSRTQETNLGGSDNEGGLDIVDLRATTNDDDNNNDDIATDQNTNNDMENDNLNITKDDPWLLIAQSFNSLRILTPILLHICNHKHRNDLELTIGSDRVNNKKGKGDSRRLARCWLLYDPLHIYDLTTQKFLKEIDQQWKNIMYCIGTNHTQLHNDLNLNMVDDKNIINNIENSMTSKFHWENAIDKIMDVILLGTKQQQQNQHDLTLTERNQIQKEKQDDLIPPWIHYHPFDDFVCQSDSELSCKIGTKLDEHFHLLTPTNDKQIVEMKKGQQYNSDKNIKDRKKKTTINVHEQYLKCINELIEHLTGILKSTFPSVRLSLYGSCLSELSLGTNTDVDISLYIDDVQYKQNQFVSGNMNVEEYHSYMRQIVLRVCRILQKRRSQFTNMTPVIYARVPVVKGTCIKGKTKNPYNNNGSIDFDICFLNDIAVANSSLIREYALMNNKIQQFMIQIKLWAKSNHISSTNEDHCISSYAWMNLVINYLQCIGIVPNLQCHELIQNVDGKKMEGNDKDDVSHKNHDKDNYWFTVNNLDTRYLEWKQVKSFWFEQQKSHQSNIITTSNSFAKERLFTLLGDEKDVISSKKVNHYTSVSSLLYGFFHFYSYGFPYSICTISMKRNKLLLLPCTVFRKTNCFLTIEDPFELYDSYCPHDLAAPADEVGSQKIIKCLHDTEYKLKQLFLLSLNKNQDNNSSNNDVHLDDEILNLWPLPMDRDQILINKKSEIDPVSNRTLDKPIREGGGLTSHNNNKNNNRSSNVAMSSNVQSKQTQNERIKKRKPNTVENSSAKGVIIQENDDVCNTETKTVMDLKLSAKKKAVNDKSQKKFMNKMKQNNDNTTDSDMIGKNKSSMQRTNAIVTDDEQDNIHHHQFIQTNNKIDTKPCNDD